MSIKIKLEVFEGPFALLYHLIEKAEIDIYDIPIAEITEQYLNYLDTIKTLDIDLASEFLIMAATLLEIKSKMLLPKIQREESTDEDPREELILKLLEYKKFKEISSVLEEMYYLNEKSIYRDSNLADSIIDSYELPDNLSIQLIAKKFEDILKNKIKYEGIEFTRVFRDNITVEDKVNFILDMFINKKEYYFNDLLMNCQDKIEIVMTFLALLELLKRKSIYVSQKKNFDKIIIKKT